MRTFCGRLRSSGSTRRFDGLLVDHAQVAGLVVGAEKFVRECDFDDVAPAAAVDWLEESVFANGGKDALPVERKLRLRSVWSLTPAGFSLWGSSMVGGTAMPSSANSEQFKNLSCRLPEGVVEHHRATERGLFEPAAIGSG